MCFQEERNNCSYFASCEIIVNYFSAENNFLCTPGKEFGTSSVQ